MKTKIRFKIIGHNKTIPFNYKKKVSSLFLKMIGSKNKAFSDKLHDVDLISPYVISNIRFESGYKIDRKLGFDVSSPGYISIEVSSFVPDIHSLLNGLKGEMFHISGDNDRIFLKVDYVSCTDESLGTREDTDIVYRSTFKSNDFCLLKDGYKKGIRISYEPQEFASTEFKTAFFQNLIKKYENTQNTKSNFDVNSMDILMGSTSSSLTKINFSGENLNVKGYKVTFSLICPNELKEVAYTNGIGNYNKNLFGFVNLVK